MSSSSLRLVAAAIALGMTGAFTVLPAAAATAPPPGSEGPAGAPALMPNGKVATPPQVTAPQVSTSCPAAPYGAQRSAPGSGKTVALTFDDGPGASTASILSILARYGVPATFFNLGQNMAARPALVRQEASAGYVLDNHTWDHATMTGSASAQAAEMDRATAEQVSLTGIQPCGFRPPGGSYNATTLSLAQQRRMKFWTWSVDTEDWKANGSASAYWVNRIISLAEQQGRVLTHPVVLMHNQPTGNPATVLALPAIIQYFGSHGYTFTDLLGRIRAPRTGDYNGDGRTDLAVWRPANGTWYVRGIATTQWGGNGDVPVPGDYNGDGRTDLAVWRPANGTWYIRGIATTQWGGNGDVPVPGDYNGDGRTDLAVWRPANGTWYVRGIATTQWGGNGDVPVPGSGAMPRSSGSR
jgi:peptidoglycan/xylan/chitin deacetylase (PgdA/CDA1 family)